MPKKMGTNSKAEEARARKAEAHVEKKVKEERQKEESYWKEAEGPSSKSSKKREEEAERKAEAVAKKLEAKKLAEQEERELEKYGKRVDKKATRVPVLKVTAAELAKRREEERAALEAQAAAAKKKELRMSNPDEYENLVGVANRNREDDIVDARDLESALAQIVTLNAPELPADRHPERRLKASYKAFEEAELPILKQEKPGLTHTQYKDILWKSWKKSPDNPLNQDK